MSKRLFSLIAAVALIAGLGTGCVTDSMGPDQNQIDLIDNEPLNGEENQGSDA